MLGHRAERTRRQQTAQLAASILGLCLMWAACGEPDTAGEAAGGAQLFAKTDLPLATLEPRPYPSRSTFFQVEGEPVQHDYCRKPDPACAYSDFLFFEELGKVPVGASREASPFDDAMPQAWQNMGFVQDTDGKRWRREATLDEPATLTPTAVPGFDAIDCVAIISIGSSTAPDTGQKVARTYIYATLKEVFKSFPTQTQVNILVGDEDVAYLHRDTLAAHGIDGEQQGRLHIHPASPTDAAYLRDSLVDKRRRASWNYARALRSYSGTKGLLLMEDDVAWTRGAFAHFSHAIARDPLPVVSLFNQECKRLTPRQNTEMRHGRWPLAFLKPRMTQDFRFWCTQGMYYSANVANELGRYMQARMHMVNEATGGTRGYDEIIDTFMRRHGLQMAYAQPSLVQHTGVNSTGLSDWFPFTPCHAQTLPELPWPDAPFDPFGAFTPHWPPATQIR